jgi:hypothetical protein
LLISSISTKPNYKSFSAIGTGMASLAMSSASSTNEV